jgi:hypothetical protein
MLLTLRTLRRLGVVAWWLVMLWGAMAILFAVFWMWKEGFDGVKALGPGWAAGYAVATLLGVPLSLWWGWIAWKESE